MCESVYEKERVCVCTMPLCFHLSSIEVEAAECAHSSLEYCQLPVGVSRDDALERQQGKVRRKKVRGEGKRGGRDRKKGGEGGRRE